MSEYKIVYLIVERSDPEQAPLWRMAGIAFVCRDGSLNLRLDMHPGLRFNIRDSKFNEPEDVAEPAYANRAPSQTTENQTPANGKATNDDVPF